ncbi:hypothetical protein CXF85_14615 [Colwellia sp. 75C3]|uniref:hypothetical protein n=1 Tax=Colwellia sp. 75C3 TaxID=888425 RepID=UPI000C32FEF7|nr:hypothetical protein [Colwellia sp. 75C3]PKG82129.1 hypothetical protein CXF85_14615 [Colwellia sp. 75C3]
MKYLKKSSVIAAVILLSILFSQQLYAHMIVAQHGTLNVVDDGVFMVLSLPVSAFEGIDDDKDGKLSSKEFTEHRPAIIKSIHNNIVLKEENGKVALQGMMLSPVTSHHSPKSPASQLMVMGRYTIIEPNNELEFEVTLFGKETVEKTLIITATRKESDSKQKIELSKNKSTVILFE